MEIRITRVVVLLMAEIKMYTIHTISNDWPEIQLILEKRNCSFGVARLQDLEREAKESVIKKGRGDRLEESKKATHLLTNILINE